MSGPLWIRAHQLDNWGQTTPAKTALPFLLRCLVYATIPREHVKLVNFPAYEEATRPGFDGTTSTSKSSEFVPEGITFWELGCQKDTPQQKAQSDYNKRVGELKGASQAQNVNLSEVSFVAVTPLDWQDAEKWAKERSAEKVFKQVYAIDSNRLEHWIQQAPAVGLWLAQELYGKPLGVRGIADYWENLQASLKKRLPAKVLLVNRTATAADFEEWSGKPGSELVVKASSPRELVDVFCAWVQGLPEESKAYFLSRSMIVEGSETWRLLASMTEGLVLVAGSQLQLTSDLVTEACRRGHHVLKFGEFRLPRDSRSKQLEMMRRSDLRQALIEAELSEIEAETLAKEAGGNFTILRRRFAAHSIDQPAWGQDTKLAPVMMAGAWEEGRDGRQKFEDESILSILAAKPYDEIQELMSEWRRKEDSPVRFVENSWEFLSPVDAWECLNALLERPAADRFERICVEVLSENDPALELPKEERYLAGVKGKVWRFSRALREGLAEMLAVSATREIHSCRRGEFGFSERACRVVHQLLGEDRDWKRWASIGDLSRLLIEAAPNTFLGIVEADLSSVNPQLVELFRQETTAGGFGSAYHAGLMWALETAAWSPEFAPRVAICLARLAALDPGGKWGNRPQESLRHLFFSWRPQTLAGVQERIVILRLLQEKEPEIGWKVVLSLLPQTHESIADSAKPTYRDWAAGWSGNATQEDYQLFLSAVTEISVSLAGHNAARWIELLEDIPLFPAKQRDFALERLHKFAGTEQGADNGAKLWEALRLIIERHSYFTGAPWALRDDLLARLKAVRDLLEPKTLLASVAFLFDSDGLMDGSKGESFDEKRTRREMSRREAIRKIWDSGGIASVVTLAEQSKQPWTIGLTLAQELGEEAMTFVVPHLLDAESKAVTNLARNFAAARIYEKGADWAEAQLSDTWEPSAIAAWGLSMPFNARTWQWIRDRGNSVRSRYWQDVGPHGTTSPTVPEIEDAIKQFLEFGRPWAALEHFSWALHWKLPPRPSFVCDILTAIAETLGQVNSENIDTYNVEEAFEYLQNHDNADTPRLARLEFLLMPFLDGPVSSPKTLHRQLSRDPELFVDCLKLLYRPRRESESENHSDKEPIADENSAERARRVWQLFHDWSLVPGNGDLDSLRRWVTTARKLSVEHDRIEVCDLTLGAVFARGPEDSDSAKPPGIVREIIEECASGELERGLMTGFFNLRGCFSKSLYEGGAQERDLAGVYSKYARICQKWPRTASALRAVSEDYLRQAEREDERAANRD